MITRRAVLSLAAAVALAGCGGPLYDQLPVHVARAAGSQWKLVGQYGPSQLARWKPAPWAANNRQQIACYTRANVSSGTELLMQITQRPCDGKPESGAWLQSPVKWRYGMFEARIYLPASGSGEIANWPAFWLEDPNDWPVNGEIDAMEVLNGWDCQSVHYGPAVHQMRTVKTSPNCVLDRPGWHTFAVTWSATLVQWYVDGHLTGAVSSHVPHHWMQIVLDYTAWRGQINNLAPATMRVAWIRIFKLR